MSSTIDGTMNTEPEFTVHSAIKERYPQRSYAEDFTEEALADPNRHKPGDIITNDGKTYLVKRVMIVNGHDVFNEISGNVPATELTTPTNCDTILYEPFCERAFVKYALFVDFHIPSHT